MKTNEQLIEELSQHTGLKRGLDKRMGKFLSDCIKASGWNLLNKEMKGQEIWDTIKAGGSVPFGNRDEKGKLTLSSLNKAFKSKYIDFEYQEWDKEDRDEFVCKECEDFFKLAVLGKNPSDKWREKYHPYVEEITKGITDEAWDQLLDNGNDYLISDVELCKLFKDTFPGNNEYPDSGEYAEFCLINTKKGNMVLYSKFDQCDKWSVKCDLNDVQSIISCAIECINHCVRE